MESVSRISSMLDPARDLTVEAAQAIGLKALKSGSSSSRSIPFAKLKGLLDSRSDRDILDGLKRVISMIYQNKPCLPYFSSVVKNVANPNIEVKKLVYIYLLHYAETDPDLALLSVNAIQKSLTDQNPQVRALALKTMSGMRVPVISQIVSLAIKRGVSDMSPLVRKTAALAIPKCYRLDPNALPQLQEYLSTLLADKQYFVVGPAIQAFLELCPDRIDLIHTHYRSLVNKLIDMDEWSQIGTLRLLLYYSRRCFPLKSRKVTAFNKKGFYDDEKDEPEETEEEIAVLDPDLELFLRACRPLLLSRNAAVITAVTSCFLYLGNPEYLKEAVGPLIALLRGPPEVQQVALCNIVAVSLISPKLFVPYASHFLLRASDQKVPQIWQFKLELLTIMFPHSESHLKMIILSELEHFSHSSDVKIVRESVHAIGRCAQSDPSTSSACFKVLLNQISSFDNVLVTEVLTVIRHLIQQDPQSHRKTVVRLARNLDKTTSPEARATIIWLVGEFANLDPENNIAPDVLRVLARGFADESEEAKQQIVLLAAKVYLLHLQGQNSNRIQVDVDRDTESRGFGNFAQQEQSMPGYSSENQTITKLWDYILLLARYDTSYDLRDRARLFKALFSTSQTLQLASLLLLAPKPVPHSPTPSESRKGLMIGTTTLVLGKEEAGFHGLPGYEDLPDWVSEGMAPDSKLRDNTGESEKEEYVAAAQKRSVVAASKRLDEAAKEQGLEKKILGPPIKPKTLDDWLQEEDKSEDEDETEDQDEDDNEDESSDNGETDSTETETGSEDAEEEDGDQDNSRHRVQLMS